jgi:ArsR family transcriptional regulator
MERKAHQNGKDKSRVGVLEGTEREPLVSPEFADELVQLFKLLSDETRLQILLTLLQQNELHVRALCDILGQSQPAVSHHLALLRVAGLIDRRREGKHNFYHLVPARFERLLGTIFSGIAKDQREFHFKDFVLSYAPTA